MHKVENGVVWGSLKVTENTNIHSNCVPIVQHFPDMPRYWSKITNYNLPACT